jgi:transposase
MISIGVDAHKSVHAAVALDQGGQVLGQWRGANSEGGWAALATWARQWDDGCQWGIEGA